MHTEVLDFVAGVKNKLPMYFYNKKVYEVGSRDINGSVRQFFDNCQYTGFDLSEGFRVDCILDWSQDDLVLEEQCDVIVCCEVLEHCKKHKKMMQNIYKNVRSGGLIVITAAGFGREEHGTSACSPQDSPCTNDYYANVLLASFLPIFNEATMKTLEISYLGSDVRLWGIKR